MATVKMRVRTTVDMVHEVNLHYQPSWPDETKLCSNLLRISTPPFKLDCSTILVYWQQLYLVTDRTTGSDEGTARRIGLAINYIHQ
jgi:hypothetical protein